MAPANGNRASRRRRAACAIALVALMGTSVAAWYVTHEPPEWPVAEAPRTAPAVVAPSPASTWTAPSVAQQRTLLPIQKYWDGLDPHDREKWTRIADRLQGRPSREVVRAAQRMAAWQQLSPAQREQARLRFAAVSRLPAAERQRRWASYELSLRSAHAHQPTAASGGLNSVQPRATWDAPAPGPEVLQVRVRRASAPTSQVSPPRVES